MVFYCVLFNLGVLFYALRAYLGLSLGDRFNGLFTSLILLSSSSFYSLNSSSEEDIGLLLY